MPNVSLRLWFTASRPFSFGASIVPVAVGTLVAAPQAFSAWRATLALLGAVAIHAGTNLVNDYYDHVKGADSPTSLGPAGLIQQGRVTPQAVLWAGLACFVLGSAIGLVLCSVAGWSLLGLGIASVLAGFLYTGAPLHLAYVALGEATVFVFMGPVIVAGAYFVQVGRWDWQPVVASLPIAFLVTAILHANNLRDIDTDRRIGKRTVATIVGRVRANWEMYILIAGAYTALLAGVMAGALPWAALLAFSTLPLVPPIVRTVATATSARDLHGALGLSALLHLCFGVTLALGLALGLLA